MHLFEPGGFDMRNLATALSVAFVGAMTPAHAEGDPDKGKITARTNCARCHGIDGNARSTSLRPVPMLAGQPEAYLLAQMRAFRDGSRTDPTGEAMIGFLARLSEQDLEDVAAYFSGQKRY